MSKVRANKRFRVPSEPSVPSKVCNTEIDCGLKVSKLTWGKPSVNCYTYTGEKLVSYPIRYFAIKVKSSKEDIVGEQRDGGDNEEMVNSFWDIQ